MGRSGAWRDEAAAALVLRHLAGLGLRGRALVMEDPRPDVAAALRDQGVETARWSRRAGGAMPAGAARDGATVSPWPPDGPFDTVLLRLPRAKEELEMLAHAAAARLRGDGRLLVYGAGDEGAGSAGRRLEAVFGAVGSVATGGRCRLVQGGDPRTSQARGRVEDWRETYRPPVPELQGRDWVSWPGVFAHGRLDDGTALLLEALPPTPSDARVLDFGCGDGVIGAVVLAREPSARVDLLDVDALALRAASENAPGGEAVLGEGLAAVGDRDVYDRIVANPPFHAGKSETMATVSALVAQSPARLAPGGSVTMVVQRRLAVEEALRAALQDVTVLADRGPFRVWHGRRGGGP